MTWTWAGKQTALLIVGNITYTLFLLRVKGVIVILKKYHFYFLNKYFTILQFTSFHTASYKPYYYIWLSDAILQSLLFAFSEGIFPND